MTSTGTTLRTADGERLHALVLPGGPDWVVLAHGFSGSTRVPALRRVAERLSAYATVLVYDARGHGRSTGRSTLGDREVLDVDAAVAAARAAGARRVATIGFSMGAAAVVRHAAQVEGYGLGHRPDAVVAVSGTSAWSTRATASVPLRRLHLLVETRLGRLVTRLVLRTRVDPRGWQVRPQAPLDCAGRVPVPLLVVHGERDGYLGAEHARALADRAGAELWVEDFGHAEVAIPPKLVDRVGARVAEVLARQHGHDEAPGRTGEGTRSDGTRSEGTRSDGRSSEAEDTTSGAEATTSAGTGRARA